MGPVPGLVAVGQDRLRDVLLVNQDARRLAALGPVLAGLDVDGVFASGDLGVRKPQRAFFETVTAILGLLADDCAFVDSAANVDGAQDAGLAAILHTSAAQLRADLVVRDLPDP